jgi:hypothetical protein
MGGREAQSERQAEMSKGLLRGADKWVGLNALPVFSGEEAAGAF